MRKFFTPDYPRNGPLSKALLCPPNPPIDDGSFKHEGTDITGARLATVTSNMYIGAYNPVAKPRLCPYFAHPPSYSPIHMLHPWLENRRRDPSSVAQRGYSTVDKRTEELGLSSTWAARAFGWSLYGPTGTSMNAKKVKRNKTFPSDRTRVNGEQGDPAPLSLFSFARSVSRSCDFPCVAFFHTVGSIFKNKQH